MVKSLNQLKNCAAVTGFISSPTVKAYQLYMMSRRRFSFTFYLFSLFTFFRCLKNIRSCKCFVDGMNSCVTNFFLLLKDNCTQLSVHILHNMLVSTLLFLSDVPSHRKRAMDKKQSQCNALNVIVKCFYLDDFFSSSVGQHFSMVDVPHVVLFHINQSMLLVQNEQN